jgi:hypothetical protein
MSEFVLIWYLELGDMMPQPMQVATPGSGAGRGGSHLRRAVEFKDQEPMIGLILCRVEFNEIPEGFPSKELMIASL